MFSDSNTSSIKPTELILLVDRQNLTEDPVAEDTAHSGYRACRNQDGIFLEASPLKLVLTVAEGAMQTAKREHLSIILSCCKAFEQTQRLAHQDSLSSAMVVGISWAQPTAV